MSSSLHPYRYWEEDGQYFFNTPSGAQYVAYFLELPFAENLYTFNFDKLHSGIHGVVDVCVCDTICTILAKFFQKHQDSMLVACVSSDGREEARMRLFESWFRRLAPEELLKIDRSGQAEEYRLFLSLFVWDDNPDKSRLIAIFDEYCQDLLDQ